MIRFLVVLHIVAGATALAAMTGALCTAKGGRWHRQMGKCYTIGMAVALALAIVISLLTVNLFLLLIGVFSAYFVYTGWRLTQTRDGTQNTADRITVSLMLYVGIFMVVFGLYMLVRGKSLGIAMAVFGIFALAPGWADYRSSMWPVGKERIVLHLNRMGGASIATVTAALVVNVQTDPAFIVWLLPTIIGAPLIVYWNRRVMRSTAETP